MNFCVLTVFLSPLSCPRSFDKKIIHLNLEIAFHGECTYALINTSEKALYVFGNQTPYTALLKDASGKEAIVKPHKVLDWYWSNPQGDQKLTIKLVRESAQASNNSVLSVDESESLNENLVEKFEERSTDGETPTPPSPRSPRSGSLPSSPSYSTSGNYFWESSAITINFNKLKEKKVRGEKGNQIIDVKVVGEGFTKNLICRLRKEDENEELMKSTPFLTLFCHMKSLACCVIDNKPQELLNFSITDIVLKTTSWIGEQEILFQVKDYQLDNQLNYSIHPAMVFSKQDTRNNFLQFRLVLDTSTLFVNSFKVLTLELQPVFVSIDVNVFQYLLGYVLWLVDTVGGKYFVEEQKKLLKGEVPKLLVYGRRQERSAVLYFQHFELSALKVCFPSRNLHR
eukprot:TRINITY_DN2479_c0_g2_i1.p1 TRINITY_DN2479_c0_g2~~TRINITY_DN2479_c0_g2_i1.p1  ORF type:complete len:398 (+),score=67.93 TRINITY_DN2479_c0_g2_i1:358-1551(+)